MEDIIRNIDIASGSCGVDLFNNAVKQGPDAIKNFLRWFVKDYIQDGTRGREAGASAFESIRRLYNI